VSQKEHSGDDRPQKIDIFYELPPSPQGAYQYERDDGSVVHGDASGKWTLDEGGEIEDFVFLASPRLHRRGAKD